MSLPPPASPPAGYPAILLTLDPAAEPPGPRSPSTEVAEGRLSVRADAPGSLAGYPFSRDVFRDVIVDAVVGLEAGEADDAYGVFFRQVAERSYLAFAVTPDGRCSLLLVDDGTARPLAEGVLPPEAPFAAGLGATNRLTVVTTGPCVTCLVNGYVLTGVVVDPRFKAGLAGAMLVHVGAGAQARLALHWAQVRAVLPDQG